MKTLGRHLKEYLALRRQLGFKFYVEGSHLGSFVRFARECGVKIITTKLAVRWATRPANIAQKQRAKRLGVVRGFAEYLQPLEPRTEVPSPKLLPARVFRPEPFLYTDNQVDQLIGAARQIDPQHPIKGLSLSTLLGLLAVTGMRVSEALALDRKDVDLSDALVTLRHSKGNKSRLIPLHSSTVLALKEYARIRDELYPQPFTPRFLLWEGGGRLRYQVAWEWFREAACRAGLRPLSGGRGGPRIHDLRHRFAIRTLVNWYHGSADVDARLPELATFLGHGHVSDTYWYVSAVPELLALATRRWERAEKGAK